MINLGKSKIKIKVLMILKMKLMKICQIQPLIKIILWYIMTVLIYQNQRLMKIFMTMLKGNIIMLIKIFFKILNLINKVPVNISQKKMIGLLFLIVTVVKNKNFLIKIFMIDIFI